MNRLEIAKLLDKQYTLASDIFEGKQYPYEVLPEIGNFIKELSKTVDIEKFNDMGAGAITSNVKSDKTLVSIKLDNQKIETNLKKFGAILGDFVEVGCGSVLNPGSIVGRNTNIYPLSSVRGYIKGGCIYKNRGEVVEKF